MRKFTVYFRTKKDLELYEEIKDFAKNERLSLSQGIIGLIHDLRGELARYMTDFMDAEGRANVYKMLFEMSALSEGEIGEEFTDEDLALIRTIIEKIKERKQRKK